MNMMTVAMEGMDKAQLPRDIKPLNLGRERADAPSFSDMLQGAKPRARKSLEEADKQEASKSGRGDEASKAEKALNEESIAKADAKESADAENVRDEGEKGIKDAPEKMLGKEEETQQSASVKTAVKGKTVPFADGKAAKASGIKAEEHLSKAQAPAAKGKRAAGDAAEKGAAELGKAKSHESGKASSEEDAKVLALKGKGEAEAEESAPAVLADEASLVVADVRALDLRDERAAETPVQDAAVAEVKGNAAKASEALDGKEQSTLAAKGKKRQTLDKDEKITVLDLRTEGDKARVNANDAGKADKAVAKAEGVKGDAEMLINTADAAKQNITSSDTQSAAANGSTFQAMVENQIRENTPEIVKAGTLLLRDNNVGTINLVMHPENLGNVRIVLHLADNVVSGQITVHSQEAYDAFKNSANGLSQAFNDSGFDSQGFTVAYSGGNDGQGQQGQGAQDAQFGFTASRAEQGYDKRSAGSFGASGVSYGSDYSVNIVA